MVKNADLTDLKLELWCRSRNSGDITWKTKDGHIIPIKSMTNTHLINTIKMLEKKEAYKEAGEYLEDFWTNEDLMDID